MSAESHGDRAGPWLVVRRPAADMLASIIGWYRSICSILCQREGDSSGRETSIAHTSLKCGSDYRRHPDRPAPNHRRNRDSRRNGEMLVQIIMPHDAMQIGLKNPAHKKLLYF